MNIPFLCIALAFLLNFLTKIPVGIAMHRLGRYDNKHPRDQQAQLTGWGKRALGAHQNSFEAFPGFAAAVLVAHAAGADPRLSAILAVAFIVARVLYTLLYIANQDLLRSSVWGLATACTFALFALAFVPRAVNETIRTTLGISS